MTSDPATAVRLWQQCPSTPPLTCTMDPDHELMVWYNPTFSDDGGYLFCPEDGCGFIRYDINPQILKMTHGERHHGCSYG